MQRLSYLTTTYTAFQDDWALSPDETRIAFWLSIEDEDNPIDHELAVLNVESGEVTNYCITGNRTPIWSPDGRQIAITQYNKGVLDFMIVDIEEGIAYDITEQENVRIEGWLVSNP